MKKFFSKIKQWFEWVRPYLPSLHRIFLGVLIVLLLSSLLLIPITAFAVRYASWAWAFDLNKITAMPVTSIIYDRNGYVLQRLFEENRLPVEADDIPEVLEKAVIAAEDQRFYYHIGFDPIGIIRAAIGNAVGSSVTSGASTITQQLARNSAQMFERTIDRKLKELFLAIRIELNFSKKQILTLYLNRIFFGRNIYGIGAAAESYFGKSPKDLTLSESAMLAGIISGPNSFSPWRNPERARLARERALHRMYEQGYITRAQEKSTNEEPLILRPILELSGSHAVAAILDALPPSIPKELVFKEGLRIHSTIDLAFQQTAEKMLEESLRQVEDMPGYRHFTRAEYLKSKPQDTQHQAPPYLQGSFVAIHNLDGGILALVGGRNFEESSFNRATLAKRQVGSTLKPFIYTHLFCSKNASAFTQVPSSEFDLHNVDEAFQSPSKYISIREALQKSDNYAAMRSAIAGGVEEFTQFVRDITGATEEDVPPFPSTALGACGLTPFQMTKAFTIFPNKGILVEPYLIGRIETAQGQILYEHKDQRKRVIPSQVSFQIHHLLEGVVEHGTAASLKWKFKLTTPIGGKTGTTDDYKDTWFVGYTTEVTAGVWIGLDQPQTVIANGYSNRIVLPSWARIMQLANQHYPGREFVPPDGLQFSGPKRGILSFFGPVVSGSEYLRQDQLGGYLERIDSPVIGVVQEVMPQSGEQAQEQQDQLQPAPKQEQEETSWWDDFTGMFHDGSSTKHNPSRENEPFSRNTHE